jgi:hypothetical protein
MSTERDQLQELLAQLVAEIGPPPWVEPRVVDLLARFARLGRMDTEFTAVMLGLGLALAAPELAARIVAAYEKNGVRRYGEAASLHRAMRDVLAAIQDKLPPLELEP